MGSTVILHLIRHPQHHIDCVSGGYPLGVPTSLIANSKLPPLAATLCNILRYSCITVVMYATLFSFFVMVTYGLIEHGKS